jgi:hypothetical protein
MDTDFPSTSWNEALRSYLIHLSKPMKPHLKFHLRDELMIYACLA